MDKTVLEHIGEFVVAMPFVEDEGTQETIRAALIDLLGCIVIGAAEEVAIKARKSVSQRPGSAVAYGTEEAFSPDAAALVNGVAGHALDFDDWETPGNTHASIAIIPALLSASHSQAVNGRAFMRAYAAGFEVIARLGEAMNFEHYDAGWHSTATLGPLGAAAAVARLRDYDATTTAHAVSIAISRASGLTAQFGSDAKPLQAGFAAEAGLVAADMAGAGLMGQLTVFEGKSGYGALTAHHDEERLLAPFLALGGPLALATYGLVFKPYPSCGYTHRIVDAALALRDQGVEHSKVTGMEIALPDFHADILPFGLPKVAREARFSLPFCAALALTRGAVTVQDFSAETWRNPEIRSLIEVTRVSPFKPLDLTLNYDPRQPDCLCVTLDDGSAREARIDFPLGSPQRPMSFEDILAKFRSVTGASDGAVEALASWPKSENLHDLLKPWRGNQ